MDHQSEFYSLKDASLTPPAPRGKIPLYIGGFVPRAMERVVRYGDGYFGNIEAAPLYLDKLAAAGKDTGQARMRLPELFTVVAENKAAAMDELAPHFHHVNNSYGEWAAEDQALGVSDDRSLAAMSLEEFKKAGILRIYTPAQAIALFKDMQAKAPVEHIMMTLPPGLPAVKLQPYAELFAREVMPAFA